MIFIAGIVNVATVVRNENMAGFVNVVIWFDNFGNITMVMC